MKKPVLILLALFALIPFAQLLAQPAPSPEDAQFIASLAAGTQGQAPSNLVPAPSFLTGCTSNAQCPTGQLCCMLCGNPPDDGSSCMGCTTPINSRCPKVV